MGKARKICHGYNNIPIYSIHGAQEQNEEVQPYHENEKTSVSWKGVCQYKLHVDPIKEVTVHLMIGRSTEHSEDAKTWISWICKNIWR